MHEDITLAKRMIDDFLNKAKV